MSLVRWPSEAIDFSCMMALRGRRFQPKQSTFYRPQGSRYVKSGNSLVTSGCLRIPDCRDPGLSGSRTGGRDLPKRLAQFHNPLNVQLLGPSVGPQFQSG